MQSENSRHTPVRKYETHTGGSMRSVFSAKLCANQQFAPCGHLYFLRPRLCATDEHRVCLNLQILNAGES
jgi:hypothetical protein